MELVCLCCLVETDCTYSLESSCEFCPEECYDNFSPATIQLNELYSQLTQLPPVEKRIPVSSGQSMSNEICSRCVALLKEFYLFRLRAQKSYEELQTKSNIAKIISHLEQSSVGSVRPERIQEDFGEDNVVVPDVPNPEHLSEDFSKEPLRCIICQKMFKMRKLFLRHKEIHLSEKIYHCQYCNKAFVAKASCYNHELKMHRHHKKMKNDNNQPDKNQEDDELYCGYVKSRIKSTTTLQQHEKNSNTESRLFSCDLCPKKFTRKSSLNDHKMVLHAGIRQHSCHICSRAFGKEDSLKTHLALHLGKTHRCKLCGKAFAKGSFLRKHLEDHESAEDRRKHVCSICAKRFTTKSHLTDHSRIHGDVRPYKCNVCGNCFRQKQQLKIHNYQHVGKPFGCGDCGAGFGARSRLKAHIEKHHRKQDLAIQNSTTVEPDFGDKVVNEEILNEICYQIDSNPIILQNIETDGENLICSNNEPIVFLADDGNNFMPETLGQCL